MNKKYRVTMSEEERREVLAVSESERTPKSIRKRCNVLLAADETAGQPANHEEIAVRCGVSPATVYIVVWDYSTQRLSYVLRRREHKNPPRKRIVTGEQEARIVALACGEAPEGHARWSIRLLREKVVELEIVESIGRETIRTTLKNETSASPEKAMVHFEKIQRRIRGEDGGCSGGLRPDLRFGDSPDLHG